MHVRSRPWLTILSLFLTLWLISGFLPLSAVNQIILTLVSVVAAGLVLWYQWRCLSSRRDIPEKAGDDGLPPEYFQGHVLLVTGNSDAWFESGQAYRETASGWYLRVDTPEQMRILAERLSYSRPALCGQVVVMLGLLPEQHTSDETFLPWLRNWQRAVMQCRQWLNTTPPVLVTLMVSEPSPQSTSLNKHSAHWFTLTPDLPGMHIRLTEAGAIPAEEWLRECDAASRLRCVSELLWLNAMLSWYNRVTDALTDICRQEHFYFRPVAVGFCLTSVAARPGNLWQQQLTSLTALPPPAGVSSQALPLPDILLSGIPRHRGLSHWHRLCRQTGAIVGVFLLLAMLASFMNNQRLVRSVGEHLTAWHRMSGYSSESKTTALQRLQADSQLLNDWQQHGVPQRYGLGLYQGMWLIPPVERATGEWIAPLPPRPVIQKVTQTPKTVRLNSLALFDAGKWTLKPGATKWLVNALVDIKAKAGWLIVVSGHTDNTGDPQRNQALSLKRAEAVRDWMRDTGDIPQSCFAVQGYGESRPVAPNDTAEGRARNRRVEISLVPQADACRLPDASPAPEEGASENITE
ncbi:OmpA family protein [Escherichia marmotae]|uniref:Outer membrane porin F n=1 Tax=Escherichia marmotae TaxID=1499973 RepID=A0A370VC52_9ESCH|nr:OmpA family protein [Escherichia marmotae]RDR28957.1 Outer membrane porin F precursor [Escherichia marmotae]RDR35574.1 Outer membrane porin F precursor [Escherichia marmotae]RDR40706.1 Outer membrane porin F precursor [Escherichia marmotae]RDR89516.1 Outer membrane porin F precursor [Escherichia marmotae]RDS18408.1 Outer membrane porin F precursor [Escherichia marmotae]